MRRFTAVHLLLGGYVVGLCLSLLWAPPVSVLGAAGALGLLALVGAAPFMRPADPLRAPEASAPNGSAALSDASPSDAESAARVPHWVRGASLQPTAALAAAVGLFVTFLVAGLTVGELRTACIAHSDLRPLVGQALEVRAVVLDLPEQHGERVNLPVGVVSVDGKPLADRAELQLDVPEEGEGDTVTIAGRRALATALDPTGPLTEGAVISLPEARVEALPRAKAGQFDYGRYLERRGIHVLLAAPLKELRILGRRGGAAGVTDRLRLAARRALSRGVRPPVREVLQGMVLGDDENVDDEAVEDFRRSGLLHIMAVSGENVVLLCGLIGAALSLLGVGRRPRLLLLLPMILAYVIVTGSAPSIVRAGVAGVIVALAGIVSRPADVALLLLVPGAVQLSLNPWTLLDAGFQLSFAAVIGLVLLGRHTAALVRFLPRPLAEPASITMAASLATAPVSLATFGQTSLIGIVANVAGGFVLGPVMFLGMTSVLVGLLLPVACVPLNFAAGLLIAFLLTVARVCARLPFAVYQWNGVTLTLLVAVAILGMLLGVQCLAGRAGMGLRRFAFSPLRRQSLALTAATLLALSLVLAPVSVRGPAVPTLTVLDVGEGAAALIQAPGNPTTLVDAGPGPLARTLRKHGVKSIDVLVLSHGHADHTGGLADVLQSFTVRSALLPRPPTPDPALERLAAELARRGAVVSRCAAPLQLAFRGYSLQILPTQGGESGSNQDENDWALVVAVQLGDQRLLLPGDVEGAALAEVATGPMAVVELPHHGSAGGLDAALLARLASSVAVISVGPNRYGHPVPEMLALLSAAGVPCLRTDRGGDVSFSLRGGRLFLTRASAR